MKLNILNSNILNFFIKKRKVQYSLEYLIKYSTSTYLISIIIISSLIIPKHFNTYILKYILPIIIASIIICILEVYYRLKLKQNIKIIYIIPIIVLHIVPLYIWFTFNNINVIKEIYLKLLFINLLIGFIITFIYYKSKCWPYYETPLEITIISILINLLFYYILNISPSSFSSSVSRSS